MIWAKLTNQVLSHMSETALNPVLNAKLDSVSGGFVEMQKSIRTAGREEKYSDMAITVNDGTGDKCICLIELKYAAKRRCRGKARKSEKGSGRTDQYLHNCH